MDSSPYNCFGAKLSGASSKSENYVSSFESEEMNGEGSSETSHHINISTLSEGFPLPSSSNNDLEPNQEIQEVNIKESSYNSEAQQSFVKESISSIDTEVKQITAKLDHIRRVIRVKEQENIEMKSIILSLENKINQVESERSRTMCVRCDIF